MRWFFLTVGYSGLFPKAPGTAGSLVALLLGIAVLGLLEPQTLFMAALLVTLAGVKLTDRYEADGGEHDDKRIVIDEMAGMWFALAIAPGVMLPFGEMGKWENGFIIQALLSFALFRLYDIKKPSFIGRIDREVKGGLGVMGDDVLAGFAAGITSAILWQAIKPLLPL